MDLMRRSLYLWTSVIYDLTNMTFV